jgi:uncharacterized protein YkwD
MHPFLSWLLSLLRPVPVGPPAPAPSGDTAAQLLALVNDRRRTAGVPPLPANARLTAAAQGWAEAMARSGVLGHGDFVGRIRAAGYLGMVLSENVAAGQQTAADVVADWMASPGHRANLLNLSFTDVGFGRAGNFWVADFGG